MPLVGGLVLRIGQDVIQIDYDTDVKEIGKDGVDEPLESCRGVRQTERHDEPFVRTIVHAEGGFLLVTGGDMHQMVGMPEVEFHIDFGMAGGI